MIDEVESQFNTPKSFSMHIEKVVLQTKMTHMEAVLDYCEQNYIDPEDIAKLIGNSLREKIAANMADLNYMKKTAKLDI